MKLLVGLSLCYWLKDNVHHLIIKKFKSKNPKSVWSLIFSPKKIANECKNLFCEKFQIICGVWTLAMLMVTLMGSVLCRGQRLKSISVLLAPTGALIVIVCY